MNSMVLFQKNIPFKDWFKLDVIAEYHDVIPAEDFMRYLAPEHWPSSERIGYCFSHDKNRECKMKEGKISYIKYAGRWCSCQVPP